MYHDIIENRTKYSISVLYITELFHQQGETILYIW